jgi:DNA (cytosine-5)-methyltransferase 1
VTGLVLSLFPGIGLLDLAFEAEGFCVVRGPDLLWGGDIKRFHPSAGKFDGVIGGPPCQMFSVMQAAVPQRPVENLIPEFVRVIEEAQPEWFVMENVPRAPNPAPLGYFIYSHLVNNRWLGEEQNRVRRFWFGARHQMINPFSLIEWATLENPVWEYAVVGGHGGIDHGRQKWGQGTQQIPKMLRLQGLPEGFFEHSPFTIHAQRKMLGNGVPLPMGRAIAKAVTRALAAAVVETP